MIQRIRIKWAENKANWIDQNNTVVGYDSYQQCCERFGWGVYKPDGAFVQEDPHGLPYHFGERMEDIRTYSNKVDEDDYADIDQVLLVNDNDPNDTLVLEFYNCHNGYYYHDFSIEKKKPEDKE